VDLELLLPIGFVLLGALGLVYAGLAGYHYLRRRQSDDAPRVPVAIVAFAMQYGLVFALSVLPGYELLLPTILMFLTLMALMITIRLGLRAHSEAGSRIALAGLFTLGAYICKIGSDYHQFVKFYR
jgi:hypothetical protein